MLQAFCRFWGPACRPLSAVALAAAALSGCAGPAGEPVDQVVGLDTSLSARRRLPAYVQAAARLTRRVNAAGGHSTLYRVDHQTLEFYDGVAPSGTEKIQELLVRELAPRPNRAGTHPAEFWHAAATRAAASRRDMVVALIGDGGNDDRSPEAMAKLRAAVERLAASPRVRRVLVWGVIPETREQLRADLAPLGNRLEIRGLDDINLAGVEDALASR